MELSEFLLHSYASIIPNNSFLSEQLKAKAKDFLTVCGRHKAELPNRCCSDIANTSDFSSLEKCNGLIGVPITFLACYNPMQFRIIGLLQSSDKALAGIEVLRTYEDFREMRQDGTYTGCSGIKANGNPVIKGKSAKGNFLFNAKTGEYVHSKYARILIQRVI